MEINKTINYLNLFHNCIDVNGAERIGKVLKINNNLIELDIGYNRIKDKGFKSIIDAIIENKDSSLKKIGLKYNFIKNKQLEKVFDEIEKCEKIKLEEIELKNNLFISSFLQKFYEEKYKKIDKNIVIDILDILYYLEPERIERSIWINKGNNDKQYDIYKEILKVEKNLIKDNEDNRYVGIKDYEDYSYFGIEVDENNSYVGIPLSIVKIRGRKTGKKKDNAENNAFVEFIMPNSVNRIMKLGNNINFTLSGKSRRIYKAGSRIEYLIIKKRVYE